MCKKLGILGGAPPHFRASSTIPFTSAGALSAIMVKIAANLRLPRKSKSCFSFNGTPHFLVHFPYILLGVFSLHSPSCILRHTFSRFPELCAEHNGIASGLGNLFALWLSGPLGELPTLELPYALCTALGTFAYRCLLVLLDYVYCLLALPSCASTHFVRFPLHPEFR